LSALPQYPALLELRANAVRVLEKRRLRMDVPAPRARQVDAQIEVDPARAGSTEM
jgi:hypothetical protein